MSNTNQKPIKFCIGAIFLLISLLWTLIEFIDACDMSNYPKFLESYFTTFAIACFVLLSSIITLCVFIFMKKKGLPLAISSFAVAFGVLIEMFSTVVLWLSLEDNGFTSSSASFSYAFTAFIVFLLFYTFVAMGISAILPNVSGLVKAMKISSLITAITYVSLTSINSLISIFQISLSNMLGYAPVVNLISLIFNISFFVGLLLTRGWIFRLIEATACPCESGADAEAECAVADCDQLPYSEPVSPAPEADAVIAEEPAPAAAVATPAPAVVTPAVVVSAPVAVAPTPEAEAAARVKLSADDVSAQLRTYKLLLDDGIITREEYDEKKKEILAIN